MAIRSAPCLTLRVAGGDGDIVDQAKAHGLRLFGVVAGRPSGDEGVVGGAGTSPRRPRRSPRRRRGCTASQLFGLAAVSASMRASPRLWNHRRDSVDIRLRMRQQIGLRIGGRRLDPFEAGEICPPSSALAIACNRSGRSGWPGALRCSRQIADCRSEFSRIIRLPGTVNVGCADVASTRRAKGGETASAFGCVDA